MELLQLKYFIKVAEMQHMTRAAQALMISQPALSKSIHQLEEELGTALFERRGKNIFLTENGRILLRRSYDLISLTDNIRDELCDHGGAGQPPLRLVVRGLSSLLPDLLLQFHAAHPSVRYQVSQNDDLSLQNQQYDLMISTSFLPSASSSCCQLLTEDIVVVCPEAHPLAAQGNASLAQIAVHPQIAIGHNRIISTFLQECFLNAGLHPQIAAECDDVLTIRNLVAAGMGVALLPRYALAPRDCTGLRLIPIAGGGLYRHVALSWKPDAYLSQSARLFQSFAVRYFEAFSRTREGG